LNGATARPDTLSASLAADHVPSLSGASRTTKRQPFWLVKLTTVPVLLF